MQREQIQGLQWPLYNGYFQDEQDKHGIDTVLAHREEGWEEHAASVHRSGKERPSREMQARPVYVRRRHAQAIRRPCREGLQYPRVPE